MPLSTQKIDPTPHAAENSPAGMVPIGQIPTDAPLHMVSQDFCDQIGNVVGTIFHSNPTRPRLPEQELDEIIMGNNFPKKYIDIFSESL